ncbi:MAG: 4-hydroxy-3-methylbut-2-enyl diphosphate reductase [Rikenellaceae bacterium]
MVVEIDPESGFCFGVVRAITEAERALRQGQNLYSLGDIVHNRIEVQRLEELGMHTITHSQIEQVDDGQLLIRAHGEPPSTYRLAGRCGVSIIDATCPVVAKLQKRVKMTYEKMEGVGGAVILLGKRGHAEVVGLTGQVDDRVFVVESLADLDPIDLNRPICLLSQTTQSIKLFNEIAEEILRRSSSPEQVEVCDTICRQVSSREEHLREFVERFDLIIFVCGKKSSNGRVLYELCRSSNPNSYNIESEDELQMEWFDGVRSVGICGATSTPAWLMERVARRVEAIR